MINGKFAYALTVGMVATVNPCGFAMLPAYLSFFLGTDHGDAHEPAARAVGRALRVSAVAHIWYRAVEG